MPRFVILEHDYPDRHWDFMLEAADDLLTWRLSALPAPSTIVIAEEIPNHRLMYLDYEGPVSGDRGAVIRSDAGEFDWLENAEDRISVRLRGCLLNGTFRLERVAGAEWRGEFFDRARAVPRAGD